MPLTKEGQQVMNSMMKEYGDKKGKSVFYASINAKKKGANKWHKKNEAYDSKSIELAKTMKG